MQWVSTFMWGLCRALAWTLQASGLLLLLALILCGLAALSRWEPR